MHRRLKAVFQGVRRGRGRAPPPPNIDKQSAPQDKRYPARDDNTIDGEISIL